MKASRAELTLTDLMRVTGGEVTLAGLIEANLVPEATKIVKIIVSGAVTKAYVIKDKRSPRPRRQERGRIGRRALRGLRHVATTNPTAALGT